MERIQQEIHSLNNKEEESAVVQGCVEGNPTAQRILYESNYNQLLGVCMRYVSEKAEAEDVLHDSFIIIFDKISSYQYKSKIISWMTRIVINQALAYLRKKKKLRIDYNTNPEELDQPEITREELQPFSTSQVFHFLDQLPIGYRTVLSLYSIDGLSHKEIANHLSISESSSRSQLTRARKALREILTNNRRHG